LRTRSLGTTTVTAIGSGDVSLARSANRGVDAREVERALHEALALGITLVDVAAEPDAERLCGDIVRQLRLRDVVVVATRVPVVAPRPGAPRRDDLPDRLPAKYVQERVEATLRATRLDALPLVQLALRATWRASAMWPELAGTAARLVREGKVLAWGAIVDELDGAETFVTEPWLASLQVTYNPCARAAAALVAAAAARSPGLAILARQPLAGGALAGALGPGVRLTPRDDRNDLDDATLERAAVAAATLAPLVRTEPPAARSCEAAKAALERGRRPPDLEVTTLAELALRYVIDTGAIALPRLHRHERLPDALVALAAPPLSPMLRERLDELLAALA